MARRRYLVSYDVSDDKRRDRIFRILQDHGDHAQYSVFFCELTLMELAGLRGALKDILHHDQDQILLLDLGLAERAWDSGMECLGKPFIPPTRAHIF